MKATLLPLRLNELLDVSCLELSQDEFLFINVIHPILNRGFKK